MEVLDIERSSLKISRKFNVVMGIMGITFAILSQSNAIMVDGLYSAVNFISSLIASKISLKLTLDSDDKMPFGYDYYETIYLTFRSLVLVGIMGISFLTSISKIFTYLTGGNVIAIKPGFIMIYTAINIVLCFSLAAIHKKNYLKTKKQSEILKAEQTAATVDGMISLGAGVALVGITFMSGTFLEGIIPIADSIVVITLVLVMIKGPIKLFSKSIKELLGESVEKESENEISTFLKRSLDSEKFEFLELRIIKSGRNYRAVTLIKPLSSTRVEEMDKLRSKIQQNLLTIKPIRSSVIFTELKWNEYFKK